MALTDKLKAIADAIRAKTGGTDSMTLDVMPREIKGIETVQEPHITETYDDSGNLIAAKMVGQPGVRTNLFSGVNSLVEVEISETAKFIKEGAFRACSFSEISIPASVKDISNQAFLQCVYLEKVTFHGTPDTIGTTAFLQCGKISTINVPWAEGAVANAPWGAIKATINYNYTEGTT